MIFLNVLYKSFFVSFQHPIWLLLGIIISDWLKYESCLLRNHYSIWIKTEEIICECILELFLFTFWSHIQYGLYTTSNLWLARSNGNRNFVSLSYGLSSKILSFLFEPTMNNKWQFLIMKKSILSFEVLIFWSCLQIALK